MYENREMKTHGRRSFLVLIHHSNQFGIVFEQKGNPEHRWNCIGLHPLAKGKIKKKLLLQKDRSRLIPLLFE